MLEPGDRVVLCSDGLSSMVRDPVIARIVRREPDPNRAAEALVDAANEAGGEDNITAVVIRAGEPVEGASGAGPAAVPDGAEPGEGRGADAGPEPGSAADGPAGPVHRAVAEPAAAAAPPRRNGRRRAWRFTRFAVPVLLIVGVAVAAVGLYARRFNFFVKYDTAGHVTVYRGVPGGLFLWSPTVEQRTTLTGRALTPSARQDVADVRRFSSADEANDYVKRLRDDARARAAATSTTTTSTTTSTSTSTGTTSTTAPGSAVPSGSPNTTGPAAPPPTR